MTKVQRKRMLTEFRRKELLLEFARNAVAINNLERMQKELMIAILQPIKTEKIERAEQPAQTESKKRGVVPTLIRAAFREHGQLSNANLRALLKHRGFTSKEIINTITRLAFTGELRRVKRGVYERTDKLKKEAA